MPWWWRDLLFPLFLAVIAAGYGWSWWTYERSRSSDRPAIEARLAARGARLIRLRRSDSPFRRWAYSRGGFNFKAVLRIYVADGVAADGRAFSETFVFDEQRGGELREVEARSDGQPGGA